MGDATRPYRTLCDTIIAQYVFGVKRCEDPAIAELPCEQWPTCRFPHPVCERHGGRSTAAVPLIANAGSEASDD